MNKKDDEGSFWRLVAGFTAIELVAIGLLAIGSGGCGTVDPDAAHSIYTNIVVRVPDFSSQDVKKGVTPVSGSAGESASSSSVVLDFKYGGFKGGKAVELHGCKIESLKVTSDKLSYKWVSGGCEALGASDKSDYSKTVACAFFWDGSKWVGGKFDWISTSRTSRSFENIKDGYHGWDAGAFFAAKKHGFCIVSADGKRRSNFIED